MNRTEEPLERLERGAARRLIAALPQTDVAPQAPGDFRAKVWTRIEERRAAAWWLGRCWGAAWLPAAALGVLLLAVGIGYALLDPAEHAPAYATLSDAPGAGRVAGLRLRAVFAPDTTLAELQALLQRYPVRVLAGPTPHGVFTLRLDVSADHSTVETLRAQAAVLLLEPLPEDAP